MANYNLYIIIISVTFFTVLFRTLAVFINITKDNKYIKSFCEFMPVAILTVIAFPDSIFALGKTFNDILIALIACIFVIYMSYKNKSLGLTVFLSLVIILILREAI